MLFHVMRRTESEIFIVFCISEQRIGKSRYVENRKLKKFNSFSKVFGQQRWYTGEKCKILKMQILKMQFFFGVLSDPALKKTQKEDLKCFFDNANFLMQFFFRVGYRKSEINWIPFFSILN